MTNGDLRRSNRLKRRAYVSTVQANEYPVTAFQWHPEIKEMMEEEGFKGICDSCGGGRFVKGHDEFYYCTDSLESVGIVFTLSLSAIIADRLLQFLGPELELLRSNPSQFYCY
ncbi:hypothetical protein QQ045_008775 [Rhodiola kirilowii]